MSPTFCAATKTLSRNRSHSKMNTGLLATGIWAKASSFNVKLCDSSIIVVKLYKHLITTTIKNLPTLLIFFQPLINPHYYLVLFLKITPNFSSLKHYMIAPTNLCKYWIFITENFDSWQFWQISHDHVKLATHPQRHLYVKIYTCWSNLVFATVPERAPLIVLYTVRSVIVYVGNVKGLNNTRYN